jgi:hypothetical protein
MLKRFRKAQEKMEKKTIQQAATNRTIPCQLIPRPQWNQQTLDTGEQRFGSYHGSFFPGVPQLWIKNWAVVTSIKVDFDEYGKQGLTKEQVLQGCVNYLNLAPPRKKYAKKQTKPLYGRLRLHKICKLGDNTAQVILITDKQKSKYFWGEGAKR